MQNIIVPAVLTKQPQINCGDIRFVNYSDKGSLFRNRVIFEQYAISFVLNGQKQIYRATGNTIITAGQAIVIPDGHSIIAEHSLTDEPYASFIIFFPKQLVRDFLMKQPKTPKEATVRPDDYLQFAFTKHMNEYIQGIQRVIASGQSFSNRMANHKLEEMLLLIDESYPGKLNQVFFGDADKSELFLKSLVERNLLSNLALEELAFLANRSLSSFKRNFQKTYGISPQKYIRSRKLEIAGAELLRGKHPGELYAVYGYENLSNFIAAFKRKFGVTPTAFPDNPERFSL